MEHVSRVLVTAASKHGSTLEIARALGRTLGREGLSVQVTPTDELHDVDGYDAVVLGSAVYYGHWLEPAKKFVHEHSFALAARPIWLFSSGPLGVQGEELLEGHVADVTAIRNVTRCVEHRTFAGKLDKANLSFSEKAVVASLNAPEGDFRDWAAIEAFAVDIARHLDPSLG